MEDKFKKNTTCLYCGENMEAKYRNKRFCSNKCRVYFKRESGEKIIVEKSAPKPAPNPSKEQPNEIQPEKTLQSVLQSTKRQPFMSEAMKKKLGINN